MTERTKQPPVSLGDYGGQVTEAMRRIEREDIVGRIWARDHTVWRDDPREIADRLGWLTVMADMRGRLDDLRAFADSVREARIRARRVAGHGRQLARARGDWAIDRSRAGEPAIDRSGLDRPFAGSERCR